MTDDPASSEPISPGRQLTAPATHTAKSSLIDRLISWLRPDQPVDLRTDLEDALATDTRDDETFSKEEKALLRNILRLRETRTEDVMVPRADIKAIEKNTSLGLTLSELRRSGHSRMPVFEGSLDQPIGMVHIKDVVSYLIDRARVSEDRPRAKARAKRAAGDVAEAVAAELGPRFDLSQIDLETRLSDVAIVRQLLFVPASMSVTDLMTQMQANRVQMALVIDEYGGTDGLISLEDLVETVVGDIEDEHDDDIAPTLDALGDGGYMADARVPLEEVQMIFGDLIKVDEEDAEEIDTVGGLVFNALGRIPVRGELIDALEGLDVEVTDADPRRIKRLKIYPAGLRRRDPRNPRRAVKATEAAPGPNVSEPVPSEIAPSELGPLEPGPSEPRTGTNA
ncbi:MAG: HlyC/CorC family transporter [Devosiaceae bacterium]|nr:HlyC/CorC family transporter [Devosiaceae bacterium MH13]